MKTTQVARECRTFCDCCPPEKHDQFKVDYETFMRLTTPTGRTLKDGVDYMDVDGRRLYMRNCPDCDSTLGLWYDQRTEVRA